MRVYFAGFPGGGPYAVNKSEKDKIKRLWLGSNKLFSYLHTIVENQTEQAWFRWCKMKDISLFLDSGAHGLYTEHVIKKKHREGYSWYESDEFTEYLDEYAEFVKTYEDVLDVYANVDVIFNPELTWKAQKYLEEEHGLSPLPAIHHGTDLKWLEKYLEAGYDYVALGGLGQEVTFHEYTAWADRAFEIICPPPSNLPTAKVHGYAMTTHSLMLRYPWYSVDSASWVHTARLGSIYVPGRRGGKWVHDKNSMKIAVSSRSPSKKEAGKHIETLTPRRKKLILEYIHEKGYKLGKSRFKKVEQSYELKENERWAEKKPEDKHAKRMIEIIDEKGISNTYQLRDELNIIYFQDLEKSLPDWPWPFKRKGIKRIGLL